MVWKDKLSFLSQVIYLDFSPIIKQEDTRIYVVQNQICRKKGVMDIIHNNV